MTGLILNGGGNSGALPPITNAATKHDVRAGKNYYNQDGQIATGSIQDLAKTIYQPQSADMVIAAGVYLSGDQIIKGVQTEEKTAKISVSNDVIVTPSSGKYLSKVTIPKFEMISLREFKYATAKKISVSDLSIVPLTAVISFNWEETDGEGIIMGSFSRASGDYRQVVYVARRESGGVKFVEKKYGDCQMEWTDNSFSVDITNSLQSWDFFTTYKYGIDIYGIAQTV